MSSPRQPAADRDIDRESVESVVKAASRAPSIHNTQPWQWVLHNGVLDLRADRTRQLTVADQDGHSLLISCGAAAELTEVALRAYGWAMASAVMPDLGDPDLLARFRLSGRSDAAGDAATQLAAAGARRSDRRPFGAEPVADEVIERLRGAAAAPGVYAHFPVQADEGIELAVAIARADHSERRDAAYLAEMAKWVRGAEVAPDGIPQASIPRLADDRPRHTDIPLRDFEVGVSGSQLITADIDERPLIAVILTEEDNATERLRSGQAMMRLMIQAELDGLASCALSQSVDLLAFRTQLRALMSWTGHPQMMMRLGPKPAGAPAPLTGRRPVSDVLTITTGEG